MMTPVFAQTLSTQLGSASATVTATTAAPSASTIANPYGLAAIWLQGDWIAKLCLLLLFILSVASWVVMVRKYLDLKKTERHTRQALAALNQLAQQPDGLHRLESGNPMRYVVDSCDDAVRQYSALKPRVDYDTWIIRAIEGALSGIQVRLQDGMALLATIGSTSPFVGLFGTVWAIYTALVKIGASGQASIERVAGPVGEALIMTAIGLAVAVPAVFGYNWLLRRNKLAVEGMRSFCAKLHVLLLASETIAAPADSTALLRPNGTENAGKESV